MKPATASSFVARRQLGAAVGLLDRRQQQRPALAEQLVQDLVLRLEVVVDEPVGDPRLVGDVGDPGRVEALAGEDADRRVEDLAALVDRRAPSSWPSGVRLHAAAARRRPRGGGWRARAATRGRAPAPPGRGRRRRSTRSSGGDGEHHAPGVDDRRAPEGAEVRRRLADLVGGEDEGLVLDRPRPQQHLPVVAAGGQGEGRGDGDQAGAAHGEDPVELGEAEVVADAQPDARPRRAAR